MSDRRALHVVSTKENLRADDQLMSTCRLGDKWFRRLDIGDKLDICLCETADGPHEIVGVAKVVEVTRAEFDHLTLVDWVTNHSKNANTSHAALSDAMTRAYGDDFSEDAIVTIIYYTRVA